MSSSRPPPIRDFASLKQVWEADGTKTPSGSAEATATTRLPSPAESTFATAQQPGPSDLESVAATADLQVQLQLEPTHLLIADLAEQQRFLKEQISRLEQDVVAKEAQVDLLTRDLHRAHEQIERYTARGVELASSDDRERVLAEDRAALASDRALFERELDELDDVKRREAEVASRESSVKQLQEELDRRKVEVGDLETSRAELDEKLLAAEAVRADYKKAESDLRSAKREIKKQAEKTDALAAGVEQLNGKFKKLQERYRLLKLEHSELQGHFTTASEALEERTKELDSSRSRTDRLRVERDQVKAQMASIPELNITSEALLQWLAQDGTPEFIGLDEESQLGWSGVGSYDADAFDRLLIELGIQQYSLPHPSITHVVVGRLGWSKEDLLAQIDMRQGQTLRVYSQEMLLAALITGRDPLDCEDAEVLDSFRFGHPALEFLAQSELEWPSVSVSDTSEIEDIGGESLGVTESPLHALGYKVGETSWLSQQEREQILRGAFEMENLPWIESDAYMEKWGTARSHQRLWRIAFHLAMLLNGPVGRDRRKPQTRKDWIQDLDWLHEKFYTSRRFRFTWPDVTVA
jgi:hypothetical protein